MTTVLPMLLSRLVACAVVAFVSLKLDFTTGFSFCFAVLLTHFALQVVYSPGRATEVLNWSALLQWILLGLILLFSSVTPYLSVMVVTMVHNALSEIYVGPFYRDPPLVRYARIVASFSFFTICMHATRDFYWINLNLLYALMFGSVLLLTILAVFSKSKIDGYLWGLVIYEASGAAYAFLMPQHGYQVRDMILYHVIWWVVYPLMSMDRPQKIRFLARYSGLSAGIFAATPAIGFLEFSIFQWCTVCFFLGKVHSLASMLLSPANPRWLVRGLEFLRIRPAISLEVAPASNRVIESGS